MFILLIGLLLTGFRALALLKLFICWLKGSVPTVIHCERDKSSSAKRQGRGSLQSDPSWQPKVCTQRAADTKRW